MLHLLPVYYKSVWYVYNACGMCICDCYMPLSVCGGQKTTLGVHLHLGHCLRQGFFVVLGCLDQASWPMSFMGFSLSLTFPTGTLRLQICVTNSAFMWILGIQTQVFRLARQTFRPMEIFPHPLSIKKKSCTPTLWFSHCIPQFWFFLLPF